MGAIFTCATSPYLCAVGSGAAIGDFCGAFAVGALHTLSISKVATYVNMLTSRWEIHRWISRVWLWERIGRREKYFYECGFSCHTTALIF